MLYTVYKTINIINNKEYIGFHKINSIEDLLFEESENGSIFNDGYLGSGKLMKMALEKYGPLNMKQRLLLITEDKEEAEQYEKDLVDINWVNSEDNYNLSIGGNVAILYGENNGFFGKKHTQDTIDKIQESRRKTYEQTPFSWSKVICVETGEEFINRAEVINKFNIEQKVYKDALHEFNRLIVECKIEYTSEYLNQKAIQSFFKREEALLNLDETKRKMAEECSKRFKGVPKSKESNVKRGKSISKWIQENPEKHKQRMNKINKNKEKIKKMSKKQTGKIWIKNTSLQKSTRHDPSQPIPDGWERGFIKSK